MPKLLKLESKEKTKAELLLEVEELRVRILELEALEHERGRAEEALKESEKKYRLLAENSADVIWSIDADMQNMYVSPSVKRLLGYTPEEVLSMSFRDILTPSSYRKALEAHLQKMATEKTGQPENETGRGELEHIRKDGSTVWTEVLTTALRDEEGREIGVVGITRDISERKRMEKELRESALWLSSMYNSLEEAVFIITPDRKLLGINAAAEKMFGYSKEELSEFPMKMIHVDRNHYLEFERRVQDAFIKEESASFEFKAKRKDQEIFPTEHTVALLKNENGESIGIVSVIRDITERKKAAALREHVERLTRHDLKSPLLAIIGFSNLLKEDENLTSKQTEMLQIIEDAGYRMQNMLNLYLALYRMEAGTYELEPSGVDLVPIITRIINELHGPAEKEGIEFHIEVRGRPPSKKDAFIVNGEDLLCYSMLANLVSNALEASPKDEQVLIALSKEEGAFVITIHNKGAVPREVRNVFFDKYSTFGKRYGTGLGTYSARLIAKTHGGDVDYTTSEKKGTTVTIRLPE